MREATVTRLSALIGDLARSLAAGVPAPRGWPLIAMEPSAGTATALLDGLSAHGIFRKYELVLDLGGGLGATARWLALRLGCTAVVTAETVAEARAGAFLTRRAGLRGRVHHLPVSSAVLPVRAARFTNVWAVETLARMADPAHALGLAFDALRPGGHLAVQELVPRDGAPARAGLGRASTATWIAAIERAGFVEVAARDVSARAGERSARIVAARQLLLRRLAAGDDDLAALAAEREALAAALSDERLGVVQLVARRP